MIDYFHLGGYPFDTRKSVVKKNFRNVFALLYYIFCGNLSAGYYVISFNLRDENQIPNEDSWSD